jgi:tetratricopeptide (TPR) repeat protein
LENLADIKYESFVKLYPDLIGGNVDFSINEGILNKYDLIKTDFKEPNLVLIYYRIGLNSYRYGDPPSALSVWQKATYVNPDSGHIYVELANLYEKEGLHDKAIQTLERCVKFVYPRKQCQEFYDTDVSNGIYEEPGFLEKDMEKSLAIL